MSSSKVDSVFRTRSLGVAAAGTHSWYFQYAMNGIILNSGNSFHSVLLLYIGLADQYADGKAAKVWQLYIGDSEDRTSTYKEFVIDQLKKRNCKTILDAACGTG